MEIFEDPKSNTIAIVDYAHNYVSVKALLDFVEEKYASQSLYTTLVTGSAGNKAYDRRKEIVQAAQNRIDEFVFTIEDTNTEDPMDICNDMKSCITNPGVKSQIIIDRTQAVEHSVNEARERGEQSKRDEDSDLLNVILIIGKGDERWIKHNNKHVPYESDSLVIKRLFS